MGQHFVEIAHVETGPADRAIAEMIGLSLAVSSGSKPVCCAGLASPRWISTRLSHCTCSVISWQVSHRRGSQMRICAMKHSVADNETSTSPNGAEAKPGARRLSVCQDVPIARVGIDAGLIARFGQRQLAASPMRVLA
jgi:hypothetical protein